MNCQRFILISLVAVAVFVFYKHNMVENMKNDSSKSLQDKINAKIANKMNNIENKEKKNVLGPDFQKMIQKKIEENKGKEGVVVSQDSQRVVDVTVDQKVEVEKTEDISNVQENQSENQSEKVNKTENKQDESADSSVTKKEGGGFCECGNMCVVIALILALIYVFNYLNINKSIN